MTREEAIDKFKTEEAGEILHRINFKLYKNLVEKRDEFANLLKRGLWDILGKIEDYPDFKVQEVQFSFLRAHIMDGTYQWLVELHDKNGDYTKEDISQVLDMKPIFGLYEECREELYQASAKYVNTLTPADCDLIMVENFCNQVMYLYLLGVYAFRGIEDDERVKKLEIDNVFRVLIGERKGRALVVFAKVLNEQSCEVVIDKISKEPTETDFSSPEYVLYDFSNYHIKERNICFRNVMFSSFKNCCLEDSEFVGCKCIFTDWRNSQIKNVTMDGNVFNCSDFTGCEFENVSMLGCRLDVLPNLDENAVNPAIIAVSFRNAVLKNVDFRGAFLAGCDFRNAEIGRINFEGADLRGAKINSKYKDVLELTDEQRNSIEWINE